MKKLLLITGLCLHTVLHTSAAAMTILGEARGEGQVGMYAVGCVIKQRAKNRGMTHEQVCLQRKQFSCWNRGVTGANGAKLKALLNTKEGEYAKSLAKNINDLSGIPVGHVDQSWVAREIKRLWDEQYQLSKTIRQMYDYLRRVRWATPGARLKYIMRIKTLQGRMAWNYKRINQLYDKTKPHANPNPLWEPNRFYWNRPIQPNQQLREQPRQIQPRQVQPLQLRGDVESQLKGLSYLQVAKRFGPLVAGGGLAYPDHYHNKSVSPYWAKDKKPIVTIGNHVFYKLR